MKKFLIVSGVAAFVPVVALGAYVAAGDSVSGPASSQPAQNVYLVGGTASVSSAVSGDVAAAGGTVTIASVVAGDIMAAGGNVNVVSGSAEDIRVVGGNLTVGGRVSGEVMAAGGQITVLSNAVIAKDSYFAGGTLTFLGTENGNLFAVGGTVHIDGVINGDLMIKRAEKVVFGSKAVVKGKIEYSAPQEAVVESGAQLSQNPAFHRIEGKRDGMGNKFFGIFFGIFSLLKLIALLSAAYLLWYLRRKDMLAVLETAYQQFWGTLLRGFAILILTPIAGVILLVSVVGSIPAVAMLAAYVALLVLAKAVAVIVGASFLVALFKKSRTELRWYHILGGLIVLSIVGWIPFVGWLAYGVVCLIALGASAVVLKAKFAE